MSLSPDLPASDVAPKSPVENAGPEEVPPVTQTVSPHAEPNNQSDSESFEARWRAVESALLRN